MEQTWRRSRRRTPAGAFFKYCLFKCTLELGVAPLLYQEILEPLMPSLASMKKHVLRR